MFTISTTVKSTSKGTVITAKGRGRQVTVPYDDTVGIQTNHAKAAGTLGNKVMSDVEQAKVWHPSGLQRLTLMTFNDGTGKTTVNV